MLVRTTLDIDDVVLSAARARARARGISVGRAVSDLALEGLAGPRGTAEVTDVAALPVLRGVPGHVVTDEMVARHRDDD